MWYGITMVLSSGAINVIYGYALMGIFAIFFVQPMRTGYVRINAAAYSALWCLICFGISYTAIGGQMPQGFLRYLAVPVLTFSAGWVIVESSNDKLKTISRTILAIAIGYAIHTSLNYFINIDKERWLMNDFFSGQIRSATGLGSMGTIIVSLIGYWLFVEKKMSIKLLALGCSIPTVLGMLQLGTRTQLVIMLAMMIMTLLLVHYEKEGMRGLGKGIVVLVALGFICILIYWFDLWGIRELIDNSTLSKRMLDTSEAQESSDEYRYHSILNGIVSLIENPFGVETRYFHNMWLDVGRIGGVIPFCAMVFFTIITLSGVIRAFFDKRFSPSFRYLMLNSVAGLLLNFFVEPVIEGMIDLFLVYCLITGMTEALQHNYSDRVLKHLY